MKKMEATDVAKWCARFGAVAKVHLEAVSAPPFLAHVLFGDRGRDKGKPVTAREAASRAFAELWRDASHGCRVLLDDASRTRLHTLMKQRDEKPAGIASFWVAEPVIHLPVTLPVRTATPSLIDVAVRDVPKETVQAYRQEVIKKEEIPKAMSEETLPRLDALSQLTQAVPLPLAKEIAQRDIVRTMASHLMTSFRHNILLPSIRHSFSRLLDREEKEEVVAEEKPPIKVARKRKESKIEKGVENKKVKVEPVLPAPVHEELTVVLPEVKEKRVRQRKPFGEYFLHAADLNRVMYGDFVLPPLPEETDDLTPLLATTLSKDQIFVGTMKRLLKRELDMGMMGGLHLEKEVYDDQKTGEDRSIYLRGIMSMFDTISDPVSYSLAVLALKQASAQSGAEMYGIALLPQHAGFAPF